MDVKEREELLALYADLRVCDVRDGMDAMGYFHYGTLDADIRPLWRTCAYGIARTVRYLPYRGPVPRLSPEEYRQTWTPMYYNEICTYPWRADVQKGDFIAIDMSGLKVGLIGSENSFGCLNDGAHGFVSNGGVRDTDEIILQKVPFWTRFVAQPMVQVRLQFDAKDIPIAIGGVQIRPGDIIVADGDGLIAVPQEVAKDVAKWAHQEHESDKKARRAHYIAAGKELDGTVK